MLDNISNDKMSRINRVIKTLIKASTPKPVLCALMRAHARLACVRARRIFKRAREMPIWLQRDVLETLQQKYSQPPNYSYDPRALERRGNERASEIVRLVQAQRSNAKSFLELGCWDGMVSCALQRMRKRATAIDIDPGAFDERAVQAGVRLLQMDAAHLQFEDDSFDFVFSYGSFEHFADPEAVLKEAIRVVRKNGHVYLSFGPLYMSPYGLHVYRNITVPYCHFLFPEDLLEEFVKEKGCGAMRSISVNRWSLQDFRELWSRYSERLTKVLYYEFPKVSHVNLIIKYPSCFRSKTKDFGSLIVSDIEVLFRKIQ